MAVWKFIKENTEIPFYSQVFSEKISGTACNVKINIQWKLYNLKILFAFGKSGWNIQT